MLEISNIKLPLAAGDPSKSPEPYLYQAVANACRVRSRDIAAVKLLRRNVDARKKGNICFVATIAFEMVRPEDEQALLDRFVVWDKKTSAYKQLLPLKVHKPYEPLIAPAFPPTRLRPVVVGTGPAGLFAALYLAKAGAKPLVVERGGDVKERSAKVNAFFDGGALDTSCNVQFGEGGAGTFSDGKLTTNTKNPRIAHVLRWFVDAGAPEEILWQGHPHIGSDRLPETVANLRKQIIEAGGEVRFHTQLVDVVMQDGSLSAVRLRTVDGHEEEVPAHQLVLACGHSARDTFALLKDQGFFLERKPFAMGVRIEHLQQDINRSQWGKVADHPALGVADYKIWAHLGHGRSVYSFCMCPGGFVVPAASEAGGVVTNGMSNFARNGRNANAALLVNVEPEDIPGSDVLGGVALQRSIEQAAYQAVLNTGGSAYQAPAQTVASFLHGASNKPGKVIPTYNRGVAWCDLHEVLPGFITEAIAQGFEPLDRKLHGFAADDAVMTAPETRSSSPVRMVRGKDLQAFWHRLADKEACGESGIYPCGEGLGYAGGIMSAAVDGLRVAEQLCQ